MGGDSQANSATDAHIRAISDLGRGCRPLESAACRCHFVVLQSRLAALQEEPTAMKK